METAAKIFESNLKSPSGNAQIWDKRWKYVVEYVKRRCAKMCWKEVIYVHVVLIKNWKFNENA